MTIRQIRRAAFILTAIAAPAAAQAAAFTGSFSATPTVLADATCAPLSFRGTISSAIGSSSLGQFAYSHSVCISGGVGPVVGSFLMDFSGDTIAGNLDGQAAASGTPGLFNQLFNYTITGGTGQFLGASGSFVGTGTVDTRNPPPQVSLSLAGNINPVPEPGTWAMMIIGFALVGCSLRRRRRRAMPAPA